MTFEEAILGTRVGHIRIGPSTTLKYVIFENIARYIGVDEARLHITVNELIESASEFRVHPSEELRNKYLMLYYRLAIMGYPLGLPLAAQLPETAMPESVADMIARRNRILRKLYDESFNIPKGSPSTTVKRTKRLTWKDMLSAEDGDGLRTDEKQTRHYGNLSVEIYHLNEELRNLAYDWRNSKQISFLYRYLITLYKLTILGFDPAEIEVMAEIEEATELPIYYWQSNKT